MKKFIKECGECQGTGRTYTNSTWDNDPQYDVSYECKYCGCEGQVQDSEALNEAIEGAQYMIDGMITRLRMTSDNIKMVAKFEMLPDFVASYKNRLHTQARALARLEMYKANLQNL
jgi:hypothetical protein